MTEPAHVTMREAVDADLPAILSLIGQPDMDNGEVLGLDMARTLFARLKRYPDYRIYLAQRGSEIVGSYALLVMDNLGHLGAPSAIVEQVLVAPSAQGGGIGRAMMRHAMACAHKAGCYKLVLSSNIKRTRAHAFYDSLGFVRHGVSFLVELEDSTT